MWLSRTCFALGVVVVHVLAKGTGSAAFQPPATVSRLQPSTGIIPHHALSRPRTSLIPRKSRGNDTKKANTSKAILFSRRSGNKTQGHDMFSLERGEQESSKRRLKLFQVKNMAELKDSVAQLVSALSSLTSRTSEVDAAITTCLDDVVYYDGDMDKFVLLLGEITAAITANTLTGEDWARLSELDKKMTDMPKDIKRKVTSFNTLSGEGRMGKLMELKAQEQKDTDRFTTFEDLIELEELESKKTLAKSLYTAWSDVLKVFDAQNAIEDIRKRKEKELELVNQEVVTLAIVDRFVMSRAKKEFGSVGDVVSIRSLIRPDLQPTYGYFFDEAAEKQTDEDKASAAGKRRKDSEARKKPKRIQRKKSTKKITKAKQTIAKKKTNAKNAKKTAGKKNANKTTTKAKPKDGSENKQRQAKKTHRVTPTN